MECNELRVHQALANRGSHGNTGQRAKQVKNRRQQHRLARRQHFRRNRRRNGIGRVMEAVDVFKRQRQQND